MGGYTKYQASPLGNGVLRWDGRIWCILYLRHRSDCPLDSWEYSYSYTMVSWLPVSSKFVRILIIDYKGVGSEAGWVIGNTTKQSGLSCIMSCSKYDLRLWWLSSSTTAVLQIGFAYSFGIFFALNVCASTSGGHFNPCVTISFCVFKKFPVLKAMRWDWGQ